MNTRNPNVANGQSSHVQSRSLLKKQQLSQLDLAPIHCSEVNSNSAEVSVSAPTQDSAVHDHSQESLVQARRSSVNKPSIDVKSPSSVKIQLSNHDQTLQLLTIQQSNVQAQQLVSRLNSTPMQHPKLPPRADSTSVPDLTFLPRSHSTPIHSPSRISHSVSITNVDTDEDILRILQDAELAGRKSQFYSKVPTRADPTFPSRSHSTLVNSPSRISRSVSIPSEDTDEDTLRILQNAELTVGKSQFYSEVKHKKSSTKIQQAQCSDSILIQDTTVPAPSGSEPIKDLVILSSSDSTSIEVLSSSDSSFIDVVSCPDSTSIEGSSFHPRSHSTPIQKPAILAGSDALSTTGGKSRSYSKGNWRVGKVREYEMLKQEKEVLQRKAEMLKHKIRMLEIRNKSMSEELAMGE